MISYTKLSTTLQFLQLVLLLGSNASNRQPVVHNLHIEVLHIRNVTSIIVTLETVKSDLVTLRTSPLHLLRSGLSLHGMMGLNRRINPEFLSVHGNVIDGLLSRVLLDYTNEIQQPDNFAYIQGAL